MGVQKRVLLVGWHPSAVNYSKWSNLSPEKLNAAFEKDSNDFKQLGYSAEFCLIRGAETARADVEAWLAKNTVDCVLIGAGVRTDADHFLVFERLVNAVHKAAPHAHICFNTGPHDSVAAVQRWL